MTKLRKGVIGFAFVTVCLLAPSTFATEPLKVNSDWQLFVDDYLIAGFEGGASLELHHPVEREVILTRDEPWEGSASGYHTVIKDGGLYRMYYRGQDFEIDGEHLEMGPAVVAYAESEDGIHWKKPDLGLIEFEGSKDNNIIWDGVGSHNFAPFLDANPDASPDARYKALAGIKSEGGLFAFKSPDGIHWSLIQDEPVITEGAFDSQNLAFWDSVNNEYRAYWRAFREGNKSMDLGEGVRAVMTGTSSDFQAWSGPDWVEYEGLDRTGLYTNQIQPYYRAPHLLIGLPTRYVTNDWTEHLKQLPPVEMRRQLVSLTPRYGTDVTDTALMSSHDRVTFHRWAEAFVRPGPQDMERWVYGDNYAAWGIVETSSTKKGAPNELSLYLSEDYWDGDSNQLRRYTLRIDGFASISAPLKGGTVTTKPLTFTGKELILNYASSAASSVRVEIQSAEGEPIDGYRLEDCPPFFGDTLEYAVRWKNGKDVSPLAGKPVRLVFELKDADVFSFRFRD